MKSSILAITLLIFSSPALAQKIKVQKVRGNQAIIEFSGGALNSGQVYEISSDDFTDSSSISGPARNHSVNLSMSLVSAKSDRLTTTTTELSLLAGYGWNFGTLEAGPMAGYTTTNRTGVTATTYKIGGYADYNMIPNTSGEIFIYGLGGQGFFGSSDSGTGSSTTFNQVYAAPYVKWFPGGGNAGFRFDVGYFLQNESGGTTGSNSVSGLMSNVGIFSYF